MTQRRSIYLFVCVMVALVLAGCASSSGTSADPTPAATYAPEKSQVWQLVAMRGKEVPRTGNLTTLMLNSESGTLWGHTACNRYFADFTMKLKKADPVATHYEIKISYVGQSQVQCPEDEMEFQQRYLGLLPKVTSATLSATVMTLYSRDKEVLKYEVQ